MNRLCAVAALVALLGLPASAAHLSAVQVEAAIAEALVAMKLESRLVPGSVSFPRSPTLVKDPKLIADRVTLESGRVEARLRCRPVYGCLAFHASAQLQKSGSDVGRDRPRRTWTAAGSSQRSTNAFRMKRGTRVMFVVEDESSRLAVQAIALQEGTMGQVIRLRAVDGKHEILRGRIRAEHLVVSGS